jgi:hypothetical protein
MDIADALSQLADIHLPQQPGLWPPAPGWWLLAAALLALALYGAWRAQQRWRLQRRYQGAIRELQKCRRQMLASADNDEPDMKSRLSYVNDVNSVLRRVALLHFPAQQVAGLSGRAWTDFVAQHDKNALMTPEIAIALAEGRFAPRCDVDIDALHTMAQSWIKTLYMARIKAEKLKTDSTQSSTAVNNHA